MFQPASGAFPSSFSEYLCSGSNNNNSNSSNSESIIDWAPPARITTAALQWQSATRRADNDLHEDTLRRSASTNPPPPPPHLLQLSSSSTGGSRSETPTGTPRMSSTPPSNTTAAAAVGFAGVGSATTAGAAIPSSPSGSAAVVPPLRATSPSFSSSSSLLHPRSLRLMNGVVGLHSATEVALYSDPTWSIHSAFHTAVSLAGFPLFYDTGLRGTMEVTHRPSRLHVSGHIQSMRPLASSAPSWGVRLRQELGRQQHHYSNQAVELSSSASPPSPPSSSPPPPPPSSSLWDVSFRSEGSLYVVHTAWTLWSQEWVSSSWLLPLFGSRSSSAQNDNKPQTTKKGLFVRSVRAGFGLHIKKDLASGANLLFGWNAATTGGVCVSGHIDVLRRLTCCAAGPLFYWKPQYPHQQYDTYAAAPPAMAAEAAAVCGALRLRLNTISFEGTTLEWGLRTPLGPLLHHIQRQWRNATNKNHTTTANATGTAATMTTTPLLHISHSSVGTMFGIVWRDVLASSPNKPDNNNNSVSSSSSSSRWQSTKRWMSEWLPSSSDVRIDLTVGVVVRTRATTSRRSTPTTTNGSGSNSTVLPPPPSVSGSLNPHGGGGGSTLLQRVGAWREGFAASSFILLSFE